MSKSIFSMLWLGIFVVTLIGKFHEANAAPIPAPKEFPAGPRVEDWTLSLVASQATLVSDHRQRTVLTVRLTNHAKRPRPLQELVTTDGTFHNSKGGTYLLRFAEGELFEIPMGSGGALKNHGMLAIPKIEPVHLAAGEMAELEDGGVGQIFKRKAKRELTKEHAFAITGLVIGNDLNLKSNTLFFNGKFKMPEDWDPIRDAHDYRAAQKKAKAARLR